MTHTPGPWGCDGTEVYAEHLSICTAYRARLDDEGNYMPNAEVNANARLIAAAPELLAALRAAKEFIAGHNECMDRTSPHGGDQEWYAHCDSLFSDCKAAIAKAEGRE